MRNVKVDYSLSPTRWPWLNTILIAFLLVVAWSPIWTAISKFAGSLAGIFHTASK